jgi:hypothetical protein
VVRLVWVDDAWRRHREATLLEPNISYRTRREYRDAEAQMGPYMSMCDDVRVASGNTFKGLMGPRQP